MMLHKPFVSLLAAFAAVGSVAAAVTPVARGGSYPPPTPPTVNECDTGTVQCCNTYTSSSNPLTSLLSGLLSIGIPIDPNLVVGLSCAAILGGNSCNNQPVCCDNVSQSGLISLGCVPININP
ncbi:hypothetical protein BC827DRAFT_1205060 [Russula dissimulans]|nr:hypothetical protein BC827DRAFT_1205060 [Russula dissimulans]